MVALYEFVGNVPVPVYPYTPFVVAGADSGPFVYVEAKKLLFAE